MLERTTITVKEAAEYLGVSDDTIYNMVRDKQIPFIQVRRRILLRKDSLDKWMAEQEQKCLAMA